MSSSDEIKRTIVLFRDQKSVGSLPVVLVSRENFVVLLECDGRPQQEADDEESDSGRGRGGRIGEHLLVKPNIR